MNESRSCCDAEVNKDVSREDVRSYYSRAALASQESLCCPTQYNAEDLSHIPEEVREISYGCGSPVNRSNIRQGETVVDLGPTRARTGARCRRASGPRSKQSASRRAPTGR